MKIAILGGGFAGLSSAYYLRNHSVTVFESAPVLGGLASGFYQKNWDWPIERAYHHLFANDSDILQLAHEVGFSGIYFQSPTTSSLFDGLDGGFEETPFDTPLDLLRFKHLGYFEKIQTGLVLAILKLFPLLTMYEKNTAYIFMTKYTGQKSWNMLWEQLFRKKFGKYAENILMSFMWARIHKRTKRLGYIEHGFQSFINHLAEVLQKENIDIKLNMSITNIRSKKSGIELVLSSERGIEKQTFDKVISTLPSPVLRKIGSDIFPRTYINRLHKLEYLSALVLLFETSEPILEKTYWLNICTKNIPMMLVGQQTNFVDKKHYGNHHLAYVGYYLEENDPFLQLSTKALSKKISSYIQQFKPEFKDNKIYNTFRFVGRYGQPLFTKTFIKNMPTFITPNKNIYIANLDMTYPYDRGVNYAVKLGREVSSLI